MEDSFWGFLENISDTPGPMIYTIIALCACLEYVFPPFPGDTVTLFAGFLVGAKEGWSFWGIFVALNGGCLVGTIADYAFGRWLGAPGRKWRDKGPRRRKLAEAIDRSIPSLNKYGVLYLSINRFLPSFRAVLIIAAGVARVPLWKVIIFGLLSSILWNFLILMVGLQVGYEKERLWNFLKNYSVVAWLIIAVVVALLLLRFWWNKRKKNKSQQPENNKESSTASRE